MRLANDDRDARFDDAALFGSDSRQGIAKELCMVETDVGDDREDRGDDIGGIEASAHADLDDSDVDLLPDKIVESKAGSHLKKRKMMGVEE